jgi:dTDP-4-dehydrorhamnose 3,5-epimerase-like enzyme
MTSKIQLPDAFVDDRGVIQPIAKDVFNDVALIKSNKGTIRANHYHKTDSHFSYVVSGKIKYLSREVGSNTTPVMEYMNPGDLFYTPSLIEHLMYFEEDTVFINISNNKRDHLDYEQDLIRVNLDKFV